MSLVLNVISHKALRGLCTIFAQKGAGFRKLLRLTNLDFLTSAGNKMHSLVRKSSLVRCKSFLKEASGMSVYVTDEGSVIGLFDIAFRF